MKIKTVGITKKKTSLDYRSSLQSKKRSRAERVWTAIKKNQKVLGKQQSSTRRMVWRRPEKKKTRNKEDIWPRAQ